MQEARRFPGSSISHLRQKLYWTGLTESRHRVGSYVNHQNIVIENILHQSERLVAACIIVRGSKIRIILAYVPPEKIALSSKENFCR